MALTLLQTYSAVAVNIKSSFQGSGGVEPYVYSVLAGGAGGTINSSTGVYTAPSATPSDVNDPSTYYDTIQVTDDVAATSTATILIGTPILLVADIVSNFMELSPSQVWVWDQKIFKPKDYSVYISISVPRCKPYANVKKFIDGTNYQATNFLASLDFEIMSRGPAARDRKEELILAFNSEYSNQQQEANAFKLALLSTDFINLSEIDGAAIPYRYRVSANLQYCVRKSSSGSYFDDFSYPTPIYNQ